MAADMFDEIAKQIIPPLVDLLTLALVAALGMGARWLRAHTKNVVAQGMIDRLNDTVATVVRETEQTVVAKVKDGGVMSPVAQQAAKEAALESLKAHLGPKGLAELKKVFPPDQIEKVLVSYIEAEVHDLHASKEGS